MQKGGRRCCSSKQLQIGWAVRVEEEKETKIANKCKKFIGLDRECLVTNKISLFYRKLMQVLQDNHLVPCRREACKRAMWRLSFQSFGCLYIDNFISFLHVT